MPVENDVKDKVEEDDGFSVIKSNDKTSFWFDNDEIDPTTANDDNAKSYVTALGNTISSYGSQSIDPLSNALGGANNARVMGMPLNYSPLDDPGGEVFSKTFESDIPVVFFHPGKPKVNRKLFGTKEEGGLFNLGKGNLIAGALLGDAFSMLGLGSYKDSRFIIFKSDWKTYHTYVQTLLQYVHASMGLSGLFSLSSYIKSPGTYGIPFYASKGTSISESSNNEYRQSDLGAQANAKAYEIREKKMLAATGQAGILAEIGDWMKETIRDMTQDIPIIGGLVGAFTETLDGSDGWNTSFYTLVTGLGGPHVEFDTQYHIHVYWGGDKIESCTYDKDVRNIIDEIEQWLNDIYSS